MANNYHLICFDCRQSLSFGKVFWIDKAGRKLPVPSFDGVFDMAHREWHKRDAFFGEVMERFLIRHRNHELRFVPEGVDELLEGSLGYIEDVDADVIRNSRVDPEPDWDEELAEWQRRIA